jgi:hypothetical protein
MKGQNVFRLFAVIMVIAALGLMMTWSPSTIAQDPDQGGRVYKFKKTRGITISILPRAEFSQKFKTVARVPQIRGNILELAKKLYTIKGREKIQEECGEDSFSALFTSLRNPDIPDSVRDEVDDFIDASMPNLPKTYTSGHFKFYYTDSDSNSDHNVTLSDIQSTATVMNNAWNDFVTNFTIPKHYVTGGGCRGSKKMIDVKVYYLGSSLYGQTSSYWDFIDLNSKHVVKKSCKRQTTPVHELFHRVEYTYGYVSGSANMRWAVEGMASWSQKHMAPLVGDWMGRMNSGLGLPDRALITSRSYDACHFWVYLGQQGNGEAATLKEVWSTYKTNGKNMKSAVQSTIINRVTNGASMDQFVGWWNFANFYKDINSATSGFDYVEDEWTRNCSGSGTNHGPLRQVPRISKFLNVDTNDTFGGSVTAYGADYYVFNVASGVRKYEVNITAATNNFGYALIQLKNNAMVTYGRTPAGGNKNHSFSKNISAGQLTHLVLVVIGNPNGGNYTVNAKGFN